MRPLLVGQRAVVLVPAPHELAPLPPLLAPLCPLLQPHRQRHYRRHLLAVQRYYRALRSKRVGR
eukprot:2775010-Rhodomonas_salina.2